MKAFQLARNQVSEPKPIFAWSYTSQYSCYGSIVHTNSRLLTKTRAYDGSWEHNSISVAAIFQVIGNGDVDYTKLHSGNVHKRQRGPSVTQATGVFDTCDDTYFRMEMHYYIWSTFSETHS